MSADSNASAVAAEPAPTPAVAPSSQWMPTWPKVIFGALLTASGFLAAFFEFSFPSWRGSLTWVDLLFAFVLVILTIVDLALRRWKQLLAALVIWAIVLCPSYSPFFEWLYGVAFRIHASPMEEYVAGCRMIEFVENGVEQRVGHCESHGQGIEILVVFYDSTGEFALPLSQRSAEWKKAMSCFSPAKVFTEENWPAHHIWENFYSIHILYEQLDGAPDC